MRTRDLKFPAPLFSAIVGVPQPILIKWHNANSLGEALDLDGERERAGGTGHRRYSYADLVRVQFLRSLQDDFGIATTKAVRICNCAFDEIAVAVEASWQDIDQNRNTLHWKPVGPWVAVEREGNRFGATMLRNHEALSNYFKPDEVDPERGPWRVIVSEIHFLVQRVDILLSNDAVEGDVKALLKSQDATSKRTERGAR